MHLLLQKPSCTGILPRDGILGVLYALLDSAKFLHFFIVFLPLLFGLAGLILYRRFPAERIVTVSGADDSAPGRFSLPGVLQMENDICGSL